MKYVLTDLAGTPQGEPRASGRTLDVGVSKPSTASFNIRADDPMWDLVAAGDAMLKVYNHANELEYFGPIVSDEETAEGQGAHVQVTSSDLMWRLGRRYVGKDTTAKPVGTTYPAAQNYSAAVLADSPRGYWRLGSTPTTDSSGNSNTLTAFGSPPSAASLLTADTANTARDLDGSTMYYEAADHSTLDLADVFSIECWVKFDSLGGGVNYSTILAKTLGAYQLTVHPSGVVELWRHNVGKIADSTTPLLLGVTYHIVATKNGANVHIYINAVDVTGTVTNQTCTDTSTAVVIGRAAGIQYVDGVLDEVAVYATALSPARVLAHYRQGALSDSGNIAYEILAGVNAEEATGITEGTKDPFVYRTVTYLWKDALSAISELGSITGSYEYRLRYTDGTPPVAQLDLLAVLGQDRTSSIFLEYGTGLTNCKTYRRARSIETLANYVYVRSSSANLTVLASDAAAAAERRRHEAVVDYGDITVASLLDALAAAHIAIRRAPRSLVELTPFALNAPRFGVDWDIGDRVSARVVVNGVTRVNGIARIWGATIATDEFGNEQPTLRLVPE